MLGHLKPNTCHLKAESKEQYQNFYCSICASLRKQHGLAYSLFINHELTLALLALRKYMEGQAIQTLCPSAIFTVKNPASIHPAIDVAAQLSTVLGWIKVSDWQADSPRVYKKAIKYPLDRRMPRIIEGLSANMQACIASYQKITQTDEEDYALVKEQSGNLSALAFEEIAEATAIGAVAKEELAALFKKAGELISMADHLVDLDNDLLNQQYNPIVFYALQEGRSQSVVYYKLLQDFSKTLYEMRLQLATLVLTEVVDKAFEQAFSDALKGIEQAVRRHKPHFMSESPAHEVMFQAAMIDCEPAASQMACEHGHQAGPCCCEHGNCPCTKCGEGCGNACKGCTGICNSCSNCCSNCGNSCKSCNEACSDCNSCHSDACSACDACNNCDCGCGDASAPSATSEGGSVFENRVLAKKLIEVAGSLSDAQRDSLIHEYGEMMDKYPYDIERAEELLEKWEKKGKQ